MAGRATILHPVCGSWVCFRPCRLQSRLASIQSLSCEFHGYCCVYDYNVHSLHHTTLHCTTLRCAALYCRPLRQEAERTGSVGHDDCTLPAPGRTHVTALLQQVSTIGPFTGTSEIIQNNRSALRETNDFYRTYCTVRQTPLGEQVEGTSYGILRP